MNVSLELTAEAAEKITRAAERAGKDLPSFLEEFVERSFSKEKPGGRGVAEILAPFRDQVEESGLSDDELNSLFGDARQNAFANRQRNQS